ncbi:MAG: pitrilysin family protein [Candidatus Cloacimonadales bacterium]
MKRIILFIALLSMFSLYGVEFEKMGEHVKEIKLENGATLLLLEDDSAPIVHCITMANVGGVDETPGITGIAHFLEHLAFKGTSTIGTTNYEAEKVILDQEDAVFAKLLQAKKIGNDILAAELQKELNELELEASKFVVNNEFSAIYTKNGGQNFNAGTSQDFTMYQISLPSNKLELWFAMESERFSDPVFREFYKERQVILDERLMTEVNSAQGRLMKQMMGTAFKVHPYKVTTIGEKEDIENITRQDVKEFFNKYYGANNLTFVLYGDIDEGKATQFAHEYLTKIPAREKSLPINIKEPTQIEERRFTVDYDASPQVMISYHVPAKSHQDSDSIDAFATMFGQSETSPLLKTLVYDKKLALYAYCFAGLPGMKYDNLFTIILAPNNGVDVEECITEVDNILADFIATGISEKQFTTYRKIAKKSYITSLNAGIYLPMQIGMMKNITGSHAEFFQGLEKIDQLNPSEIIQITNKYIVPTNRTIGILEKAGK